MTTDLIPRVNVRTTITTAINRWVVKQAQGRTVTMTQLINLAAERAMEKIAQQKKTSTDEPQLYR